jgi:hypothetical protein
VIKLITYHDEYKVHRVSHGIDTETGKVVILPQELVSSFPTIRDDHFGLVIKDEDKS